MARKKVTLAWIAHDATRRATFKKRKQSLFKKLSELATLCGVDVCGVVYGPEKAEPEVWPSPAEAARVLARLRAAPEPDQGRKKMDQEGFLRLRVAKLQDQVRRQQRDNRELEANLLLHEVLSAGGRRMCDAGIEEAAELVRLVEMKLVLLSNRIEREKARMLADPPRPPVEQVVGAAVSEVEPKLTEEDLTVVAWPLLTEEDLSALPWLELTEEELTAVPSPEQTEEDLTAAPWPELTEEDLTALAWPELTEEELSAVPLPELTEEDLTAVALLPELTEEALTAVPLSWMPPESTWLEQDYHQWQDTSDLFNNFNY